MQGLARLMKRGFSQARDREREQLTRLSVDRRYASASTGRIHPISARRSARCGPSRKTRHPSMRWFRLLAVVLFALAPSCGTERSEPARGTIRGVVWASGPVDGAVVSVYQLAPDGRRLGDTPLGTSAPTVDGVFEVDVGVGSQTLYLEARGEAVSYTEIFTGEPVTGRVTLDAIVVGFQPNETRERVVISPFTTAGAHLAYARLARGDKEATIGAAATTAYQRLSQHLGGGDVTRTVPADPSESRPRSLTVDVKLGLAQAGLSYLARRIAQESGLTVNAVNTAVLAERLAADAAGPDALFDGRGPSGDVSLGVCPLPDACMGDPSACDTVCRLDPNTLRAELGEGIAAFVGSSRNGTGLEYPDVAALVEGIRSNTDGELFPATDLGEVDREAPEIVWESPTPANDAIVQGTIEVRARATDALTAEPSLRIVAPDWLLDTNGDLDDDIVVASIDTAARPEDTIVVVLEAEDAAGNLGMASRRFFVDRGPPVVEIVTPVEGGVYGSDFILEANAFDSTLVSFAITDPPGLTDQDSATARILALVGVAPLSEGPRTFSVLAADGAGNNRAASVTVTIDKTPPVVAITEPAALLLTSSNTLAVTGSAIDATSDVAEVEVKIGGTLFPATLGGTPGHRTFSAAVLLSASACDAAVWNGVNQIEVRARDVAGNWSAPQFRTVTYDNCAPTVSVVPRTIYDERDYLAGFLETSYAPCLYVRNVAPATTTLSYPNLNAPADPGAPPASLTIYKYAINTGTSAWIGPAGGSSFCPLGPFLTGHGPPAGTSHDAAANPIVWQLAVEDNVDAAAVASVQFRIKAPGAPGFDPTLYSATAASGIPGVTHLVTITSANAGPALATTDGVWQVQLVITDQAGNVKMPWPIRWNHRVLGGPVLVKDMSLASVEFPAGSNYLRPSDYGLTGTNNIGPLYTEPDNDLVLKRFALHNGTPYDTYVRVVVPTVSASWSRQIWLKNPNNGSQNGTGPNCASKAFAMVGATPGACLATYPTDSTPAATTGTDPHFVDAIEAWKIEPTATAATACIGGSCGTNEWLVPHLDGADDPGDVHVYLLTSGFAFLWDSGSPLPLDQTVDLPGTPDPKVFGEWSDWGENVCIENPIPPPPCFPTISRHRRIRYLRSASLSTAGSPSVTFEVQLSPTNGRFAVNAMPTLTWSFSYPTTTEDAVIP